jgi:hypothetical protein
MAVVTVIGTLAAPTAGEADLVDAGRVMLAGYVPDAILIDDVLGVLAVELAASVDSGGGFGRWVR